MKRVSITLVDQMFDKLEQRTKEKELRSMSDSVRELVNLGFRIEEAAAKSHDKENEPDMLSAILSLKNLLKINLVWSLEARLLARFLVESYPNPNQDNMADLLEQYKVKAQKHVDVLVNQEEV